jgi:hypothetical protein
MSERAVDHHLTEFLAAGDSSAHRNLATFVSTSQSAILHEFQARHLKINSVDDEECADLAIPSRHPSAHTPIIIHLPTGMWQHPQLRGAQSQF